jgi:glycosyltransferase involved in cell wall biosynthesis
MNASTANPSISVVVPVYNGASTLGQLVDRIDEVLGGNSGAYEIILVNDGSYDRSWDVIQEIIACSPHIMGLDLMQNYGQHNALLAGIRAATYDVIVTIDDDLQNPPEEIPRLVAKLSEGYDIVYGRPVEVSQKLWRKLASKFLKAILRQVLGLNMASHMSSFRAFRSVLCQGFKHSHDANASIDVLLSWGTQKVTSVTVTHDERRVGQSGYNFRKLISLAFNMLTGYSILPLRLANLTGLVTAFVGFATFVFLVIKRLVQPQFVPGFAFIASEVALFAGLQLFAIGIIGEYLARVHFRTMGKPAYVLRQTTRMAALSADNPAVDSSTLN